MRKTTLIPFLTPWLVACATTGVDDLQIDTARISATVRVLASDEFEGRAPGTPGEEKTVAYLVERFTALGLTPGGDGGGWTQAVRLIHTQIQEPATAGFSIGDREQPLEQARDVEISTVRPLRNVAMTND